jgi:succinate dehydrogenase / fumarate reductase iron-sulfur subunit
MDANTNAKRITFRVQRYDPAAGQPRWGTFELDVDEGMTVLEALHAIKEHHDGTLAWRASCRMGVCGSCGMFINGRPRLACQTQVLHLETDVVELAPLPNYPIVKDLVADYEPMFRHHAEVKPQLMRPDLDRNAEPRGEFLQRPEDREAFDQFTYCIKCGICLAACPTVATDPDFLGPQALAQAERYNADSRDDGFEVRQAAIDRLHGPYQCHLAGACTDACPKGVDPALGIQLVKRELSLAALGRRRRPEPASIVPLATEHTPNDDIPKPPPRTVG